ncbi:hypothetical protein SAMN04487970_1004140 [Paenibacillus tianmuensis]|uniref:Uncharacterized protein n=1 Tax=Paenibacillus tianmuensis TaxID=624147 RepID=A0A1G4PXE2_9BACL|nr:hypothetical protein [Paenibacillus tianmuensis]SCW36845.1 hypothetical protein SAMN04487970_1004140 [Paenibacillus tianmuensis]
MKVSGEGSSVLNLYSIREQESKICKDNSHPVKPERPHASRPNGLRGEAVFLYTKDKNDKRRN